MRTMVSLSKRHLDFDIAMQRDRLLRLRDVQEKTGMGRNTIYRMMNDGRFPCAVRPSPGMTRWKESEVDAWISDLPQAKSDEGIKEGI